MNRVGVGGVDIRNLELLVVLLSFIRSLWTLSLIACFSYHHRNSAFRQKVWGFANNVCVVCVNCFRDCFRLCEAGFEELKALKKGSKAVERTKGCFVTLA